MVGALPDHRPKPLQSPIDTNTRLSAISLCVENACQELPVRIIVVPIVVVPQLFDSGPDLVGLIKV